MTRRSPVTIAVLAGVAALAGCGWFGSSTSPSSGSGAAPAASCPTAAVLRPLANTAVFAPPGAIPGQGPGRRPGDVAFYGILSEVTSNCEISGDAARVKLDLVIVGERGPAARGNAVELDYFVAVTGPGESILGKKQFAVHIDIPPGERRAGVNDHIEETIPLAGRGPGDLTIAVGFQQRPDVVEFYKHFRGR